MPTVYNCDCRRFALIKSISQNRLEKWLTQFIPWILFICMSQCVLSPLSPLGGWLVAMGMDKDNAVFICYFFLVWTNQQVFSRIGWKVINQASPRMRESNSKEEEANNNNEIVMKQLNGNAFTIALNMDTRKPIGCGWWSVKRAFVVFFTYPGMNELMALSVTVTQNIVCLDLMLGLYSSCSIRLCVKY